MPEMPFALEVLAVLIGAYLIGSLPTGVVVARLYRNIDVTQVGSQRTGATNVARTLGLGAGAVVLLGDLAKGAGAVALALAVAPAPLVEGLGWLVAILGHTYSIFLGGRGGRGVGTGLGGLAVVLPAQFLASVAVGLLVVGITRYVSLGSIVGCGLAVIGGLGAYLTGYLSPELAPFFVINPTLVIWAHRDNIHRLLRGEERRLGRPAPGSP